MADRVVFTANPDGTFDLTINGRVKEYDVDADDFRRSLKRLRLSLPRDVQVEDLTGYRQKVRIPR